MHIRFHQGDLPQVYHPGESVAIDTETMGLHLQRDRLCLVQMSNGDGSADVVQIGSDQANAPNLKAVLENSGILKIFHFGRFDMAILKKTFNANINPVYCTKIASKFARTYTDQHSLKVLCREILDIDLEKTQQSSDWGSNELSKEQLQYAASDVIYLHKLKSALDSMLEREGRAALAAECFKFLPTRVDIDLQGWNGKDIFAH